MLTTVVLSTSLQLLDNLLEVCRSAEVAVAQRRLFNGRASAFLFQLVDADGRLRPKRLYHVWEAERVTVASGRVSVQLASASGAAGAGEVYAVALRPSGEQEQLEQLLRRITNAASASRRGQSAGQEELADYHRCVQLADNEEPQIIIRRVRGDVHVTIKDEAEKIEVCEFFD